MRHWNPRTLVWLALLCIASAGAPTSLAAEPKMSFPLGPFYRPGKYLPVHVVADSPSGKDDALIEAGDTATPAGDGRHGAIRTRVSLRAGRIDAIVPWLVLNARGDHPRLSISPEGSAVEGPELKRLGESDRLVGWTTPDEAFARELLRGAPKIIPVALDPSQPIAGDPAAWEMLDAIILDPTAAARLDERQLAGLLAGGVTVAVKGATPPFPVWPWKRIGDYAVLRYVPAGPTTAGYHDGAYLPVAGWQAGLPWPLRRQVTLIGMLCTLPLLGLAVWRPRFTPLWGVAVAAAMSAGVGFWASAHRAIQQAAGEIVILNDDLTQTDAWTYQSSPSPRVATGRWTQSSWPMISDDIDVTLDCDGAGRPTGFTTRIPAGRKVAFLARTIGTRAPKSAAANPVTSPLQELADELYLTDGGHITGQLPGAPTDGGALVQWNAVVVDRRHVGR